MYAHRRWLYEESLQTLRLVFGPLMISLRDWRQLVEEGVARVAKLVVSKIISPSLDIISTPRSLASTGDNGNSPELPVDQACSLCGKYPIAIPYETDACQHIFCYTCLWSKTTCRSISGTALSTSWGPSTGHEQQQQQQQRDSPVEVRGTGYPCPTCYRLIRSSRPVPMHRYHQRQKQQDPKLLRPMEETRAKDN